MGWRAQMNERGVVTHFRNLDTGEIVTARQFEHMNQMQSSADGGAYMAPSVDGSMAPAMAPGMTNTMSPGMAPGMSPGMAPMQGGMVGNLPTNTAPPAHNPFVQPGAVVFGPNGQPMNAPLAPQGQMPPAQMAPAQMQPGMPGHMAQHMPGQIMGEGMSQGAAGKNLRIETARSAAKHPVSLGHKGKSFLDATSIAILMPTLVLLALIIAAAHKKRLFPWQTIRTFNPPSGLMTPREYERSFVCPPNGRRHGRIGKKNPSATWTEADGVVIPFGFLARTHLPVTIPMGRLPNKNMFIVAPSGSGKTTLMRAIIKAMLAKPCVIIALEAKANDPNLDEKREGFKYTVLPEAQHAGFRTLYFNPLDSESIHWNPLDLDPNTFASSIVQDINSLPPEEQHWAERDMGYIEGLVQLLKWGAVQVLGEDENGQAAQLDPLPCNPFGLMKLVNNRRNIVESMRKLKADPSMDAAELSELTQRLSSIIRTDSDWDKNIQGVRGRLRMFKNAGILRVTHQSNVDMKACMREPTVLIFGAPASLGPDAESLAACFVYQLQQALHTRYGTKSVLPLFAFFDEYQTLNIDLAGRLSAIVRGANGGLTVILQNVSQIEGADKTGVSSELKTIFSNSAVRVCLHNADETTAKFFSDEIGKHAIVVPGVADHFQANGFGIFPTSWNRIHSQQVVARVDTDSIKRMEKQHALVYLSPAGDPEFGETKPFMVDLRGIEEIARLHLLHNVSAKRQPPRQQAEGDLPSMPEPLASPAFAQTAASVVDALSQAANQTGYQGNGMQAGAPSAHSTHSAGLGGGGFVPTEMGSQSAFLPEQPSQPAAASGARICTACNKPAGKGKFCIECGQFIGAAPQAELVTAARVVSDMAMAGGAPQAAPGMIPAAPGVIPTFAQAQGFGEPQSEAASPEAPQLGSLSATPQQTATPRYGGLAPQSRDAMPGKRALFEGASQIAETAQQVLSDNQRKPVTSFGSESESKTENKRKPGLEF
jgi:hypothetical protein